LRATRSIKQCPSLHGERRALDAALGSLQLVLLDAKKLCRVELVGDIARGAGARIRAAVVVAENR